MNEENIIHHFIANLLQFLTSLEIALYCSAIHKKLREIYYEILRRL